MKKEETRGDEIEELTEEDERALDEAWAREARRLEHERKKKGPSH